MTPPKRLWPSMARRSWQPSLARTLRWPFTDLSVSLPSRERHGPLTGGRLMGQWTKARIQLCGRFVADIDGSRIEDTLPGRIGRVLFAYLVLSRGRPVPRDTLLMAGWGEDAPAEAGNALSVQLSRLRHGLGAGHLRGRAEVELLLPPAIFVDAEAALEGAHRAESSIAEGRWAQAPPPHGSARAPRQRR